MFMSLGVLELHDAEAEPAPEVEDEALVGQVGVPEVALQLAKTGL